MVWVASISYFLACYAQVGPSMVSVTMLSMNIYLEGY